VTYGAGTYGATEFAAEASGAAPTGPLPAGSYTATIPPETRGITPGLQPDPVIPFEDRGVTAMPSATCEVVTKIKDPDAIKDYYIDWSNVLEAAESILSSTWSGGGLGASAGYVLGGRAYTMLSGGVSGTTYVVANTIVTSSGRSYTREFRVTCEGT
jgi:hypothetical protein